MKSKRKLPRYTKKETEKVVAYWRKLFNEDYSLMNWIDSGHYTVSK